jgi:hypothetical protein
MSQRFDFALNFLVLVCLNAHTHTHTHTHTQLSELIIDRVIFQEKTNKRTATYAVCLWGAELLNMFAQVQ